MTSRADDLAAPREAHSGSSGSLWWTLLLRREIRLVLEAGVLAGGFWLAYLLRFDFQLGEEFVRKALLQLPLVVALEVLLLRRFGAHRSLWRYVGLSDIRSFAAAAGCSSAVLLLLRLGLPDSANAFSVPISVILMNAVLAYGGALALRILRRSIYERFEIGHRATTEGHERVLLVGAGRAGSMAAREIGLRVDADQELIGFVDDDPAKQGTTVAGLAVLGTTADLPALLRGGEVDRVAITVAEPDPKLVRRVFEHCEPTGTRVQLIPGLYEILQEQVSVDRFRDVRIHDLLGRDPVEMDSKRASQLVTHKVVMVTGAGGSIGSEIARQVARFGPSQLLLVERAEGALFGIEQELLPLHPDLEIHTLVADVGDEARMRHLFERHRPQGVFHAAAHKHVPMMEANPSEAIQNNALATEITGRLAGEHGAEAFVLLSTDKAVRPRSVMGASKRLAELVVEDLAERYATRYVTVRFGNVLDSAGSVVPIFREQIRNGGPVTVTHPDATRYFMTIPEAVQLVLEAGAIGSSGDVLILDMGEPVKIRELAELMIRLSGQASRHVEIAYTGLRPGEKIFEELLLDEEATDRTVHPRIFTGRLMAYPSERLQAALKLLRDQVATGDGAAIREQLTKTIPESQLEAEAKAGRARVA